MAALSPRRALALVALAAALPATAGLLPAALFTNGLGPLELRGPDGAPWTSADCGECHTQRHREWQASGHARAWTEPLFQVSWADHPQAWCVNCHLPGAAAQAALYGTERPVDPAALITTPHPVPEALAEGVGCPACHLRDGEVLTPSRPSWLARRMHPVRQEPTLASADFCGGCHEFNFPLRAHGPFAYGDQPIQSTLSEWRTTGDDTPCQGCHMPRGRHTFPGAHDDALLARTLDLELAPLGPDRLRATLTATGAAHRVPTGDPFRKLVLELCGDDACETRVGRASWLRVHGPTEDSWALVEDRSVPPPAPGQRSASRAIDVALDGPVVAWRLWMVLGEDRLRGRVPEEHMRRLVLEGGAPW